MAWLAAMVLLLAWGSVAQAQQGLSPIVIPGGFAGALPLDERMQVLVDPSGALTLEQAMAAPFQLVHGSGLNLGYTTDTAWVRFALSGSGAPQAVLLSLSPNFVDMLDVHVVGADGVTVHGMGDHRPLPDDTLSGLDNVVPLTLAEGQTTLVYIRVASPNSSLNLSAMLYAPASHRLLATLENLVYGAWFGGMAVLLAIQLVFAMADRRHSHLLLALSSFGAMLVYTGNLGLSRLLLFPDGGAFNDLFTGGAVWFGLFASSIMGASILEMRRNAPWMHRLFMAAAGIGLVGVVFVAFGQQLLFAPFGGVVIQVAATAAMVQGLRNAGSGRMAARLHAAAFFILWLGLVLTVTQRMGLPGLPNWVAHAYGLAILIQTLLLTGALAVRLHAAETMNRVMGDKALVAARHAEQDAMARVAEKTRELAAAKRIAEEALSAELQAQRQQVRFMEVISHQYRTPLASIRSNVDSIGMSLAPADGENRERLERVRRGIMRLVEVLEINLTRSRLQGSAFQLRPGRVALGELVVAAAVRARDLLNGAQITVEIATGVKNRAILADAEMLGIAVVNLLENAVKFSTLCGVPPVVLSCGIKGETAVIAVIDRGIGIPADEIEVVLGLAVRGSNAASIEGSGMGLSLVSRIAAEHGGIVEIDSVVGVGTTVRLSLPMLAG